MKINEAVINERALKLIREMVIDVSIYGSSADKGHIRAIGSVLGVLDFADALKEALQEEEG